MAEITDGNVIRLGEIDLTDGRRADLIDDMALPFLDLAEKIEAAKINGASEEAWRAIFETNLFLWRFISNFLPRHFSDEVSGDTADLLSKISGFMTKVTVAMAEDGAKDAALLDKVIKLNLNMCDQILAMRGEAD
ncbi:hypothetical protein [Pacificispira sp.]|uniref:hypothetical protein n=1 Tax=Pacificispira sp. TaxID=2888761 RepID=UPI003BAC6421